MKEFKRFSVWLIALMAISATTATLQAANYDFKVGQLYYEKTSGTEVMVVSENGNPPYYNAGNAPTGALTIPAGVTHEGTTYQVTAIGNYTFISCDALTSVSIPASVTSIGTAAFSRCSGLTAITVEAGNPNYVSADGVLYNKARTELIQCPAGKTGAFTIPASVTTIGNYAFYGCRGLTSVSIPASVTTIRYAAFLNCTGLTSVSIPAGVTTIEDFVFASCTGLTSVSIPASVTTIGESAFRRCTGLKTVTVHWKTPLAISSLDVFYGVTLSGITLNVPAGKIKAYQAADVWKNFGTIMTVANETVDGLRVHAADGALHLTLPAAETVRIYNLSGSLVKTLALTAGNHVLPLPDGFYLVSIGTQVRKVMVK